LKGKKKEMDAMRNYLVRSVVTKGLLKSKMLIVFVKTSSHCTNAGIQIHCTNALCLTSDIEGRLTASFCIAVFCYL